MRYQLWHMVRNHTIGHCHGGDRESRAAGHNSAGASPGNDVEPKKPQKSTYYLIPLYEMQKHTNLICDDRSQAIGGQGSFGRAWVKSKRDSGRPAGYRCYEGVFAFKVHCLCTWDLYTLLWVYYTWIFFPFIFISWRLITLQYYSGFCHTLTWISHRFTCIPHPDPLSHLPLHPIPLGLPSAPAWAGDLFHPR